MKESKFAKDFRQLRLDMKEMTFGQKVEHIWLNFKEYILVFLVCALTVGGFLYSVLRAEKEVLLCGTVINTEINAEGMNYISTDYFDFVGGNSKTQEVQVSSSYFKVKGSRQELDYSYNVFSRVTTMASANMLDYLISDELALSAFIQEEIYLDLNEIFSKTEMAEFAAQERLIYAQPEGGEKYPIAINLEGTAFAQKYLQSGGPYYISFITTSPRRNSFYGFWEYLLKTTA